MATTATSTATTTATVESRVLGFALLGLALMGCGSKDRSEPTSGNQSGDDGSEGAATEAETPTGGDSSDEPGDESLSGDGNDDPSDSDAGDEQGATFILEPDGGGIAFECDLWAQDCPEGEKCMPWANDGGTWNATRCSALDPSPAQPGDECEVEGNGASGIDNCALGSMCWNVDPETNLGACVPFCMGSEASPICEDPSTTCSIANEGAIILCLPNCDPLLQDCQEGEACYPVGDDIFVCGPDVSGEMGLFGDPCAFINVCDPGLFCAPPNAVPDCQGATGCCSSFCDTSEPDASTSCPGAAGGQECVSVFPEGQAPPGLDNLGACSIPA